ncbi:selenide, water dikinase SelD [Sphaerochaeta sp. PS]|uniref:selenide, water dikinase SelD n=1 Tax=Sphaerochaeta sp. PS TaxID=3076336 RepID=UPI0028A3F924|nr:selenide, water dikinase SelD [Sphaerochaeta sp. PS]MDT4762750.1 selenide, water dikinase SelD [Sphaerochaeta sp. PS]
MVKLTSLVKTAGCAAKLSPKQLHEVLDSLPFIPCPELVGGYENSDDALVYRLEDGTLVIQTVDFFPPMVDDPFIFGQVAAANALSDIYAMGSEPKVAMNLLCFPSCLELDVMRQIMLGGQSKVAEAGAVIAGGHTISDPTPKYGLCVTGFGKEGSVWKNEGALEGDLLVLTKSLGVGIINTAVKAGLASEEAAQTAIESMVTLNKYARDVATRFTVHAATDVTGFSLLGHLYEMAHSSKVTMVVEHGKVPMFEAAKEYSRLGMNPGGLYNNKEYLQDKVKFEIELPPEIESILYDPQTSGGLLLAMPAEDARLYCRETGFSVIGFVERLGDRHLTVR